MNPIATAWRKMDEVMARRGVPVPQRRLMCQSFYGGANEAATDLARGFDGAESPEDYARLLAEYLQELQEVQQKGVPKVIGEEGDEGRNGQIIILPGQE
jgi:hypothetical protein